MSSTSSMVSVATNCMLASMLAFQSLSCIPACRVGRIYIEHKWQHEGPKPSGTYLEIAKETGGTGGCTQTQGRPCGARCHHAPPRALHAQPQANGHKRRTPRQRTQLTTDTKGALLSQLECAWQCTLWRVCASSCSLAGLLQRRSMTRTEHKILQSKRGCTCVPVSVRVSCRRGVFALSLIHI